MEEYVEHLAKRGAIMDCRDPKDRIPEEPDNYSATYKWKAERWDKHEEQAYSKKALQRLVDAPSVLPPNDIALDSMETTNVW